MGKYLVLISVIFIFGCSEQEFSKIEGVSTSKASSQDQEIDDEENKEVDGDEVDGISKEDIDDSIWSWSRTGRLVSFHFKRERDAHLVKRDLTSKHIREFNFALDVNADGACEFSIDHYRYHDSWVLKEPKEYSREFNHILPGFLCHGMETPSQGVACTPSETVIATNSYEFSWDKILIKREGTLTRKLIQTSDCECFETIEKHVERDVDLKNYKSHTDMELQLKLRSDKCT